MEKGEMRVDVNISIHPTSFPHLSSQIVELKNLSSYSRIQKSAAIEIARLIEESKNPDRIQVLNKARVETRGFNQRSKMTYVSRQKECAGEYRLFRDPDLPDIHIHKALHAECVAECKLIETPRERRIRYINQLGSGHEDNATLLVRDHAVAQLYDEAVGFGGDPIQVAKWLLQDIAGFFSRCNITIEESYLTGQKLADLIIELQSGSITGKIAKTILPVLIQEDKSVTFLLDSRGLRVIRDIKLLTQIIDKVLKEDPTHRYKVLRKSDRVKAYIAGQVIKLTDSRADPIITNAIIDKILDDLKNTVEYSENIEVKIVS
eukprot:GHVL01010049.1.p1 GENE.GHVL01010049.1~~GHVL01010049.1.p1  ORF type:complete len:319 (+),score=31.40 GHVL01010049.1:683-1639(+)